MDFQDSGGFNKGEGEFRGVPTSVGAMVLDRKQ